jgi:hypothetical protein
MILNIYEKNGNTSKSNQALVDGFYQDWTTLPVENFFTAFIRNIISMVTTGRKRIMQILSPCYGRYYTEEDDSTGAQNGQSKHGLRLCPKRT